MLCKQHVPRDLVFIQLAQGIFKPQMTDKPTTVRPLPYESCRLGAHAGFKFFGYDWFSRTFGLGVIKLEMSSTDDRVKRVSVATTMQANTDRFKATYASSLTIRWFELMETETLNEVHACMSALGDVCGLKFVTNLRQSSWFGLYKGRVEKIVAPTGFYIHMLHGECDTRWLCGACCNIGAYFVPRELFVSPPSGCTYLGESSPVGAKTIGGKPIESGVRGYFHSSVPVVHAVMIHFGRHLRSIWMLDAVEYKRYLEPYERIPINVTLLALLPDEQIICINARYDSVRVTSVQFETTVRTTEWYGSVPGKHAKTTALSISERATATHIGGVYGVMGTFGLVSLGALYYKM